MDSRFVGIALSMATVALVIITIAVFIAFGGTALFYVLVFLTIAIGFVNTWYISNEDRISAAQPAKEAELQAVARKQSSSARRPARRGRRRRARASRK